MFRYLKSTDNGDVDIKTCCDVFKTSIIVYDEYDKETGTANNKDEYNPSGQVAADNIIKLNKKGNVYSLLVLSTNNKRSDDPVSGSGSGSGGETKIELKSLKSNAKYLSQTIEANTVDFNIKNNKILVRKSYKSIYEDIIKYIYIYKSRERF